MKRRSPVLIWSLNLLAALALGCGSGGGGGGGGVAPGGGGGVNPPAVTGLSTNAFNVDLGRNTGLQTSGEVRVVTDAASWQTLWTAHTSNVFPAQTLPPVDFNNEVVIAAFQGLQNSGGFGIEIFDVRDDGQGGLEALVRETTPAPGTPVTLALTSPFHIVRAQKPTGAVSVTVSTGADALSEAHGRLDLSTATPAIQLDLGGSASIVDVSAITAAGGADGQAIALTGTLTGTSFDVTSFVLDDTELSGSIVNGAFESTAGARLDLTGRFAAGALATRAGSRLRVTGVASGSVLSLSSYRVERLYSYSAVGGLAGLLEFFFVDLDTGNFTYDRRFQTNLSTAKNFANVLTSSQLSNLIRRVDACDIPSQPAVFLPTFPIADIPLVTFAINDATQQSESEIEGGASLPTEVGDLVTDTRSLIADLIATFQP